MDSNESPGSSRGRGSLAFIWPRMSPDDSEALRRKKIGVRGLNGLLSGIVIIFTLAVCGDLASRQQWMQLALVATGALVFLTWSLRGLVPAMEQAVGPTDSEKEPIWPVEPWPGTMVFFGVEILFVVGIFAAAQPANPGGVWRVLLYPVLAHAVILLQWRGIAVVAAICGGIYLWAFPWHVGGIVRFVIECTFCVVCMHMVVSAQKGRATLEILALDLEDANRQLGSYAAQAEELAVARERNRMAREIHDSLGHYLTVIRVQLEAALAVQDSDPGKARDAMSKAQTMAEDGLREIRDSIATLRATPLEQRTLCEALLALVAESEASGLPVKMEVQGVERKLSEAAGLTLYRVAQEGLTNIRKHAPGAKPRLLLTFDAAPSVRLTVSDDGPGCDSPDGGFGLVGLRERASLLRGSFSTETAPGEGFTLTVELPE